MTVPFSLAVAPLVGNIGAEISGMDVAGGVSDENIDEVRRALLR